MIVLDFEGTIYNEAALRQEYRKIFNAYGLDFETFSRIALKHGHFSLESINKINIENLDREEIIKKCLEVLNHGEKYLYPDAAKFIKDCNCRIGILSFGDQGYQMLKIKGSGIFKNTSKIEITCWDKSDCGQMLPEANVYVDNEIEVLKRIGSKYKKINLYFIDRGGYAGEIPSSIKRINKLTDIKWNSKS